MGSSLRALLVDTKVSEDAVKYLDVVKKLVSITDFACTIDVASEMTTKLLAAAPAEVKDDTTSVARCKMAWRKAFADMEKVVKRSAKGLDPEDEEEPLGGEVQRQLVASFVAWHRWVRIDVRTICCDGQLAIFRRSFEKKAPKPFEVGKARSVAETKKYKPQKRTKLAGNTYFVTGDSA